MSGIGNECGRLPAESACGRSSNPDVSVFARYISLFHFGTIGLRSFPEAEPVSLLYSIYTALFPDVLCSLLPVVIRYRYSTMTPVCYPKLSQPLFVTYILRNAQPGAETVGSVV